MLHDLWIRAHQNNVRSIIRPQGPDEQPFRPSRDLRIYHNHRLQNLRESLGEQSWVRREILLALIFWEESCSRRRSLIKPISWPVCRRQVAILG